MLRVLKLKIDHNVLHINLLVFQIRIKFDWPIFNVEFSYLINVELSIGTRQHNDTS